MSAIKPGSIGSAPLLCISPKGLGQRKYRGNTSNIQFYGNFSYGKHLLRSISGSLANHVYIKTPLWKAALKLETDSMVSRVVRH
jgi:hypothetical protein